MPYSDPARQKAAARRWMENPSNRAKQLARVKVTNQRIRYEVRAVIEAAKACPCGDCGGTFDPVCMDFDHRPGTKKLFNVANANQERRSVDRVLAEIAKCDVVCSNCHRLRTKTRRIAPESV